MMNQTLWPNKVCVLVGTVLLTDSLLSTSTVLAQSPFDAINARLDQLLSQSTDLSGVTQNWDKALPIGSRFTVLAAFNNQAVRDNNTGLVWEQAPDATGRPWAQATNFSANKAVGGTVDWRLPSVIELKSVQDPTLPATFVPASVFTGIQPANFWSASSVADNTSFAWTVQFATASGNVNQAGKASGFLIAWCVRGGMNADKY